MLVEIRDGVFGYGGRAIVRVGALRAEARRCLGIFGPNGVGKTTLVRGMTGLLTPLSGTIVRSDGIRFGYLPQHRTMELHWPMTALDAASLALSARRWLGWVGGDRPRIIESLKLMRVENLMNRPFAKLSGGQQQRVLLAGALAADPHLLVLDETTEGLDVQSRKILLGVLRAQTEQGLCTVLISHDVEDLLSVADEVAWLHAPDLPGEPGSLEVISPNELAERVVRVRRAV